MQQDRGTGDLDRDGPQIDRLVDGMPTGTARAQSVDDLRDRRRDEGDVGGAGACGVVHADRTEAE